MSAGRYLRLLVACPRRILAVAVCASLLAGVALFDPVTRALRFTIDPSMTALLPQSGTARAAYERSRRQFRDDDLLFVVWTGEALFTPARLAAFKSLTRRLEALPGVLQVDSLANAVDAVPAASETVVGPLLRTIPGDLAAAARLRERALAHPLLRGQLVAHDGRGLLIAVHFAPELSTSALRALSARIGAWSRAAAGDAEQFLSGPLLVRLELGRLLQRDLARVTPLAILASLLVAAAAFRNLRGTVLPLLANSMAVVVTLGVFVAGGHALDFVTIVLPSVVFVVGFSYSIHVVSEFERHYLPGVSSAQAVAGALSEVFTPLALTAATTALGFASLAMSDLDSIKVFGLHAALGAVLAWGAAMSVVPAGLLLLPGHPRPPAATQPFDALAARLSGLAQRRGRLVLAASALFALAAALAATRVEVDTDVLANLDPETAMARDFAHVAQAFAGPVPLRILIEADAPDGLLEPARLRAVAGLAAWLVAQPEIGGVYALTDYLALLQRALAPEAALIDGVPAAARLIRHLFLSGGPDLARFVDPAFTATLVYVRASTLSTAAVNALAARIQARLAELPPGLDATVTGLSHLSAQTVDALSIGQMQSLAVALLAIALTLSLYFRSLGIGLLALIPNLLPIALFFGLLGAIPISLNLTTSLVACTVFGIAVDDTVMLFARYRAEARRHGAGVPGLRAALAGVLRPVSITAAALCAGLLALTASELRNQADFGLLAAATLAFAWLLDLTLTPALLVRLRP